MSLLGMPARRPVLQTVYRMRPELYDASDAVGHPTLVVGLDEPRRIALMVTRTSSWEARGPMSVTHPPAADLKLERPGWWRLHWIHRVPYMAFADLVDVQVLGLLDEPTWRRIQIVLGSPRPSRGSGA